MLKMIDIVKSIDTTDDIVEIVRNEIREHIIWNKLGVEYNHKFMKWLYYDVNYIDEAKNISGLEFWSLYVKWLRIKKLERI